MQGDDPSIVFGRNVACRKVPISRPRSLAALLILICAAAWGVHLFSHSAAEVPVDAAPKTLPANDVAAVATAPASERRDLNYVVRRGDALFPILVDHGVAPTEADAAVRALRKAYDPRSLKAGQRLALSLDVPEGRLARLAIDVEPGAAVEVIRTGDDALEARRIARPLLKRIKRARGTITASLFVAADKAGLAPRALAQMVRAFSYSVDFQRQIQPGDTFEAVSEETYDERGRLVGARLLYGALTLSGLEHRIFRFAPETGRADFFDEQGQSVRRSLMRTPIDGARLSSGYGKRKHPILGYTRMHRGVDFAAAQGTPVVAAGDGVIAERVRHRGYGRYLRIQHGGGMETAYAHLSGFAKGTAPGQRVRQGQVIGYVGATGLATGPHLHYEILTGGKQINPLSIKSPPRRRLEGVELARFRVETERLTALARGLQPSIEEAARD